MRYIDMQTWSRRNHFRLFRTFNHPHFSMCVNVDITAFYPFVKRKGYSFTVSMVYVISRASNAIPEFRHRIRGEQVVEHETVNPGFTILVDKDLFSFCTIAHAEDFPEFAVRAAKNIAYVKAHPLEAEARSIHRIIRAMEKSGVKIHFCHISSALGLNAVLIAKKEGLPVTSEVTPHNLLLSSEQYKFSGNFALTVPPLRPRDDVSVLWSALKQGFVDVVASDHAPHALDEKKGASVWEAKPGIPGLETTLSLFLTKVNEGRLSFGELVRVTAEEPAAIFNLSNRGFLKEGNWADLVVVDMKREYEIDSSVFFSKAKYSPFDGIKVKGKPVKTFVNGKLVMDEGKIIGEIGYGKIVTPILN